MSEEDFEEDAPKKGRPPIMKKIIKLLGENTTYWMSEDKTPFVDVRGEDGKIESLELNKSGVWGFASWFNHFYFEQTGGFPRSETMKAVKEYLNHEIRRKGEVRKTAVRYWGDEDTIYVDLNDAVGRTVRITKGTIEVLAAPPQEVRFVRMENAQALPVPDLNHPDVRLTTYLKKYLDVKEADMCLITSWLVGCLRPKGPYPILMLTGEQGSGKSTAVRMLRKLIDPHNLDLREPFENPRDMIAAVRNTFVLAFDNVSKISFSLSDQLCRIATGSAAMGGRALYENTEESAARVCAPIILNGIPDFAERGDLIDRAIHIHLPTISMKKRRDDDEYWREFERDYPKMLGALYYAAQEALKNLKTTKLDEKPRMSAFAVWVQAAEPKLGWKKNFFMESYKVNREIAESAILELNGLASSIMRMTEKNPYFTGTYSELAAHLLQYLGTKEQLPLTTMGLSSELRRVAPLLKKAGIHVYNNGRKTWGIEGKGRSIVEIRRYELGDPVEMPQEETLN